MNIDERIIAALAPAELPTAPNVYDGDATDYLVFNYSEHPDLFGDDWNEMVRVVTQVHLFLPHGKNPNQLKKKIKAGLKTLAGTPAVITNASDSMSQHYVFEFSFAVPED